MKTPIKFASIVTIIFFLAAFQAIHSNQLRSTSEPSPTRIPLQTIFQATPTPKFSKYSPNTVRASLSVLSALSSYYVASNADQTVTDNTQNTITRSIEVLLKQNQYLEDGNTQVKDYINDSNQIISLTATGMTLGANNIIKANNDLISFIRTADLSDPNFQQNLSYAMAKHSTDQDDGFKTITQFSPQISSLYYDYPKSKIPSGPIPYLLSSEDRQTIINDINTLFGEELKKYPKGYDVAANNYIAILVAVDAISKNVVPNTYEEALQL